MKSDGEWISISDMMSGLMMVFLFIAISFMIEVERDKKRIEDEREKVKGIAKEYKNSQKSLYIDLNREFKDDLKRWVLKLQKIISLDLNPQRFYLKLESRYYILKGFKGDS